MDEDPHPPSHGFILGRGIKRENGVLQGLCARNTPFFAYLPLSRNEGGVEDLSIAGK
jgi:hypothetical protein